MDKDSQFSSQRKAARRAREQQTRAEQEKRQQAILKALCKPNVEAKGRVDRFLENHTAPHGRGPHPFDSVLESVPRENLTEEFFEVARVVEDQAPKLIDKEYMEALSWACKIPYVTKRPFVRPPAQWEPRGKGRDSLFRSLIEHLLAKFPVTPLLWSVFFDKNGTHKYNLLPLVGHVAGGGSLVDFVSGKVKSPGVLPSERPFPPFPIPLTRKMCHELLAMPSGFSFVAAVRRVQVRAAGGSERLLQAILTSQHFATLGSTVNEPFMQTVIEWLARNPMLDASEVPPLLDYIAHRRYDEAEDFTMKGRSAVALVRAMHAWHDGLTRVKSFSKTIFVESGYQPITLSMHRKDPDGQQVAETWRIREILTGRQLADEGRRQNHCVYSYERSIVSGHTSIWSMTMEDGQGKTGNWAQLTIELRNATRTIVQARGRFNRRATAREHSVMARWAAENKLSINLGQWG